MDTFKTVQRSNMPRRGAICFALVAVVFSSPTLVNGQERTFSIGEGPIDFLAISPSSDLIAITAFDFKASRPQIVLFDISKEKSIATFRYDRGGFSFGGLAFSRDGKCVTALGGGGIPGHVTYWGIESGAVTKTLAYEGGPMAMTDRWLVTRDFPVCKMVRVYDLEKGERVAVLKGFATKVENAAISKDGKQIALRELDGPLRVLEVATGKEIFKSDYYKDIRRMQFLHSEPSLAAVRFALGIHDLKEGKAAVYSFFRAEAISSDGKLMAARGEFADHGEEKTTRYPDGVHVFSRAKKKIIATFPVNDWKSGPMQFTPNNRFLVCGGSAGGIVRVWDVSKLEP